jgi:hypothetical protein
MDKKGSSTIESAIIVPIIIMNITSFILIMITTYQYNLTVMEGINEESAHINTYIRGLGFKKEMTFNYERKDVSSRQIQNVVEFLIHQTLTYQINMEKFHE